MAGKQGGGSKHFLCFWHLTTQNWRVRVGSPSKADEETNAFYDTAKNWVKSWFTIGVKTRTEFDYSTQRFYKWMAQEKTKEALGDKVSTIKIFFLLNIQYIIDEIQSHPIINFQLLNNIIRFVRENLMPVKEKWAGFSRAKLRSFDTKATSQGEAQN